jgi:hypothetical protein
LVSGRSAIPVFICSAYRRKAQKSVPGIAGLAFNDRHGQRRADPVRTLLCHRHNDVSDLQISNLLQATSVRPVTVSAISLHFRRLVVRILEVPEVFLLRDRSASRMANSFRQELIAELFDEEN